MRRPIFRGRLNALLIRSEFAAQGRRQAALPSRAEGANGLQTQWNGQDTKRWAGDCVGGWRLGALQPRRNRSPCQSERPQQIPRGQKE